MKNISIVHIIILVIFIVTLTQICSTINQDNPALILKEEQGVFLKKVFTDKRGDSIPYRILWPKDYNPREDYPLVLFLHGAGERGDDNEAQLIHGSSIFLDSLNQITYPCIAIFPQCPSGGYWSSVQVDRSVSPAIYDFDYSRSIQPSLFMAIQLMREIVQIAPVDTKRLYVIGLSMGGMGTFEAVYRYPDLWAGAIPICGGGDPGAYSRHTTKVPFRIYHGAEDQVVSVEYSREMVNRLEELEGKVIYTEYPDVNHNSWDLAFKEPGFLSWLFAQEK